jgi:RNA polymerase sigma-70 factor (ECF subfamily)
MEYTGWLLREGIHTAGERLAASSSATTVRVRDGNRLITDGPYTETKEVLGGYYIIECDDLDEALEAAARCPAAFRRIGRGPADHRHARARIGRMTGRIGREAGVTAARAGRDGAGDRTRPIERRASYRDAYGSVLATLIRFLGGDFDAAEEALADAFATALETWPRDGIPANPAAWLTTAARNRALDRIRRDRRQAEKLVLLERELAGTEVATMQLGTEGGLEDDRLRLIFTCCHPALQLDARVALTLRTLGGLTTPEIARAFLVPEATLAQRLVRAKRKIRQAAIPYRVPLGEELPERLDGVLATLYLVFNEGYLASSGEAAVRHELCAEAIRLAALVADLMPDRPETHGLLALLLLQDSGARPASARTARSRCSRIRTGRAGIAPRSPAGLEALDRGFAAAAKLSHASVGPYLLQASIAAEHARTIDGGRPTGGRSPRSTRRWPGSTPRRSSS